ncbi:DUF2272 domain-containing protein [Undibacterium seohonense]|uniref:DUF2272 domain-containing protein n=1 Tax=Undibacterium seohonense TaxID=1344950 RepID=A0ABR6X2W7_9BURK|nr:DUF2272 domain-containing protein [Undibacterium seohonense]MBC3806978.1 DUF2272 domain-containing protein [Undibacterium seohonense]
MEAPSPFASQLANIAKGQHSRFHQIDENDVPLSDQIKHYWLDLGFAFPGLEEAWSAVFVSWCLKQAGANASEFKFASAHAKFVHKAIENKVSNLGVFRAWKINEYAPKIGDIIQNNRGGNTFDYAYASAHRDYPSHSAIVVETGVDSNGRYALTIGGNESDSIRSKIVRTDVNGLIVQRTKSPFICVVQNLK